LPPPQQLNIIVTASLCTTAAHCRQSTNFSNGPRKIHYDNEVSEINETCFDHRIGTFVYVIWRSINISEAIQSQKKKVDEKHNFGGQNVNQRILA
jgi:hypothetical protein